MSLSSIVIKVKYGETLRRISPYGHDKKLGLDIFTLKEKIHTLFGFSPNAVFTMTYEDEDGDMVTLATDDDIRDVMQQSLDPLRITVKLTYGNNANNHGPGGLSGASAPMKLPNHSSQPQPKNFFPPQPQNSFQPPPPPPHYPFQQHQHQQLHQQHQRYQLQQQLHQLQLQQQQIQSQLQTLVSSAPVLDPQFQTMNAPSNRVNGGGTDSSGSTNSF